MEMEMELDYGPVRVVDESADTAFVIFFFLTFDFNSRSLYTHVYAHTYLVRLR